MLIKLQTSLMLVFTFELFVEISSPIKHLSLFVCGVSDDEESFMTWNLATQALVCTSIRLLLEIGGWLTLIRDWSPFTGI
jgi:hypothetical protein